MDEVTWHMHLRAGLFYGRTATCGDGILKKLKQDYRTQERADKAARELSSRIGKALEGYPCPFCNGWHIGRRMTPDEVARFKEDANGEGSARMGDPGVQREVGDAVTPRVAAEPGGPVGLDLAGEV